MSRLAVAGSGSSKRKKRRVKHEANEKEKEKKKKEGEEHLLGDLRGDSGVWECHEGCDRWE